MTVFDDGGVGETEPRIPKVTSSRIQAVPGKTNNRTYTYPETMLVLVRLGRAARSYLQDEGVLPSHMQVAEDAYTEVEPFLVPYGKLLHYWLDGNNPILVSVYDRIGKTQVKCIGQPLTGIILSLARKLEHAI